MNKQELLRDAEKSIEQIREELRAMEEYAETLRRDLSKTDVK